MVFDSLWHHHHSFQIYNYNFSFRPSPCPTNCCKTAIYCAHFDPKHGNKNTAQSAFFDFCTGNHHQIVAGARVKAMKVTPKLLVARVEVPKVAQLIGLSCKCGTNYTLCCGLARVRVESDKIVLKIRLSSKFGACAGGKVAQLIGLSCKCGTNYTLCCGLARVRVESDKIVLKIRLSSKFGACAGGNSENGAGNTFPVNYKECSLEYSRLVLGSNSKMPSTVNPRTSTIRVYSVLDFV